jgi:hypothetical protein
MLLIVRPTQELFITIAGDGLQNLDLCLALRAFEQGRIYIVLHLPRHGASNFSRSHPKDHTIQTPLTTHNGMWGIFVTRILTGLLEL